MLEKMSVGQRANASLYFTPRLSHALAAIPSTPLTVLEAPMGYGKTVAVREFLAKSPLRTVWTPVLGPSPDAFWSDFCRELEHAFPEQASSATSLLRLGYPYDAVRAREARSLLLEFSLPGATALVIDDVHFLGEQDNGRGLALLCELLAQSSLENLRIVLISRSPYTGSRELLELKGLLRILGRNMFALEPKEIQSYYAACGVSLDMHEAHNLHARTGGWISALYLFLLHHGKDGGLREPAGTGESETSPPAIHALIGKELYAPLSRELKELLFALAPLERATAPQADFVYGSDTRGLLHELLSKNSFVFFDAVSGAYTLHAIFRQYIQDMFERLPRSRQQDIHCKCAQWFLSQGEYIRATEFFHAANDFESAMFALESDMGHNLVTEKARFFVDLFKACPEEILARHLGAAFKYAIAAFSAADFSAFGAQIGWLAKHCAALPPGREGDEWRGELEFLLSLAAFNDIEAMSVHHRRANELLRRPTGLFGPESPWTLGSPSVLFMFYRESGQLVEEIRRMHECLPHYYTLASGHGSGGEYLMEAEALYNAGDFERAAVTCHKAEAMALRHGQLSNVLCALFLLMRLALMGGDLAEARRLVSAMRCLIKKSRDYFLLHTVDICEGWLYAQYEPEGGTLGNIPPWLLGELAEDSRLYAFARGFYYIVHGRLLLLTGQYAKILGLFGYLLESGLFAKNLLAVLYARIFMACAHHRMGNQVQARVELSNALRIALPDNLHMPFVENFDFLEPVLKQALSAMQSEMRPDVNQKGRSATCKAASSRRCEDEPFLYQPGLTAIMCLAATWQKKIRRIRAGLGGTESSPLTRRELELATLAANGMQYKAIAERLGLATSTVKRSFASMYKKLGISNQLELRDYLAGRKL